MDGKQRREEILHCIKTSGKPISGSALAEKLGVSRQVIVQDVALLRANKADIISTNRGYILRENRGVTKIFKVFHSDEQTREELNSIVDLGGTIADVFVKHKVYGIMRAELNISSRRNVQEFMQSIEEGKSQPLKNITSGFHYHTISADSEKTMDLIENMLSEKNFLIKPAK